MSIYSDNFNYASLTSWEQSNLDLPIPDKMWGTEVTEWQKYIHNLSPGMQVKKFAEAVDQVLSLFENPDNTRNFLYENLSPADKEIRHAKLQAVTSLSEEIDARFCAAKKPGTEMRQRSEIGNAIEHLVDFLEITGTDSLEAWKDREVTFHKAVMRNIVKFYDGYIAEELAGKNKPPNKGPKA